MALFDEVTDAESRLGIIVDESLIARMHAGRYSLGLASLTPASIVTIEGLKNQSAQIKRVDGEVRGLFYSIPA